MKKKILSLFLFFVLISQNFIFFDISFAESCPVGYSSVIPTTPSNSSDSISIAYSTNAYSGRWGDTSERYVSYIAHYLGYSGTTCYRQGDFVNGISGYDYKWNGTSWVYLASFGSTTLYYYDFMYPNTTPSITSVSVPAYINSSNVSSTPFTINGVKDPDSGQTLTYSYSWDGTNWTTIGTESTPKNNTTYSFNLNTTSRPQGNNILRVKINDGYIDSNVVTSVNITKDTVSPTLTQITAVTTPTNDTTPNYTFSSNEAGSITYGGSCSSSTTSAVSGNNTVTFSALPEGVFSNCTIKVTDVAGNQSSVLNVASFKVDTTAPVSPNNVEIAGGGGDNYLQIIKQ